MMLNTKFEYCYGVSCTIDVTEIDISRQLPIIGPSRIPEETVIECKYWLFVTEMSGPYAHTDTTMV